MAISRRLREQVEADLKLYPRLSARLAKLVSELNEEELAQNTEYRRGVMIVEAVRRLREKSDDRHNYIMEVYYWHGQPAEEVAELLGLQPQAIEWVARQIVRRALEEFRRIGLDPYTEDNNPQAQSV